MAKDKTKTDLLQGTLDLLILKTLQRGPIHGFGISLQIRQMSQDMLQVEQGSLYPALYRLEREGLIKARWDEETKGRRGPRRRVYRLTAKGTAALSRGREEWRLFARVMGGILGGAT